MDIDESSYDYQISGRPEIDKEELIRQSQIEKLKIQKQIVEEIKQLEEMPKNESEIIPERRGGHINRVV